MLGEFSIRYEGNTITDQEGRSKKLWMLIEYLVTFRGKEVTQGDLIDLLWDENSKGNSANTLKTLVHRARTLIEELKFADPKNLIVYSRGTYTWNDKVYAEVDADLFEDCVKESEKEGISIEYRLQKLRSAIELYKGDFLPKMNMEPWAAPIASYYRTMYIKAVHSAVEILSSAKGWDEVISICEKAVTIDPYDESLHSSLIKAMVNTQNLQMAKNHYESVTKMFYERFGVAPSPEFSALYKIVVRKLNQTEMDINTVREYLNEAEYDTGAFYCEFEVFKEIYQMEVRASARRGDSIFICLLTVINDDGSMPEQSQLNNTMSKLLITINESLRRGDVYTRYSASQYLIMLQSLTIENADMVSERIIKRFKREYPRIGTVLKASTLPIETVI